jgi:rod shape-determining protein MreC
MRKLFSFIIKYSVLILFLFLEIISIGLIVRNSNYPQSIILSSGNSITASLYNFSSNFYGYFYLNSLNEGLAQENVALKNKLTALENQLSTYRPLQQDSTNSNSFIDPEKEISYINAKVISNSTNKILNYITLNKGKRDGIQQDMGVINEDGVVGIISNVSEKFSVVIPVLNPKIQISTKFIKNNYSGPLQWDGGDYRYANLKDIARHVQFSLGDSLVTTSYTHSFPEGVLVGRIEDFNIKESDPYYRIKVKLAVNFKTLSYVKVINYANLNEQKNLENPIEQ